MNTGINKNSLKEILARYGGWIYGSGAILLLISSGYSGSLIGKIVLAVSILAILIDPVGLLALGQRSIPFIVSWGAGAFSLLLYFLRAWIEMPQGSDLQAGTVSRIRSALLFLFLMAFLGSIIYRILLGLSHFSADRTSANLQQKRGEYLRASFYSIIIAVILLILVNYIGAVRNPTIDLSPGYYSFSENSRTLIRSVDRDIQVYAFLPVQQAVQGEDRRYTQTDLFRIAENIKSVLEQLPTVNGRIQLTFRNAELEADRGEDFSNVTNGTIVVRTNKPDTQVLKAGEKPYLERRVYIQSEKDMDKLEKEMVKALVQVSSPEKVIYMTAMNGERNTYSNSALKPAAISKLQDELRFYNYKINILDKSNNWPASVPDDCNILMIIGPSTPLGDQARNAVYSFLSKGGSIFVAIDPSSSEDFSWLLGALGSDYRLERGKFGNVASMPGVLISDSVGEHPITENLKGLGQTPLVFPETAIFKEERKNSSNKGATVASGTQSKTPAPLASMKYTVVPLVFTPFNTLIDKNGNNKKDGNEEMGRFPLGLILAPEDIAPGAKKEPGDKDKKSKEKPASAQKRVQNSKGSLAIFSGVNWISDSGLDFPVEKRNTVLVADTLFWMTQNPIVATIVPQKRESRRVEISDDAKFKNMLFGIFLFPLFTGLLVGGGTYFYRKRSRFSDQ